MATKSKKAKSKGKQKSSPVNQQKISKEQYFLSGRLKNLPQGPYYSSSVGSIDDDILVMITRKHINDNISFGLFYIDGGSGLINKCYYEFNSSMDKFNYFVSEIGLQPTSDKEAMELLVYEAEELHRQVNEKTPANFWIVKNILEYDFASLKKGNPNRMFRFQYPDERPRGSSPDGPTNSQKTFTYSPNLVQDWNKQKWDDFIQNTVNTDHSSLIQPDMLNPWLYIFEKLRLDESQCEQAIMAKIDQLTKAKTVFAQEETVEVHPLADHQEQIEQHALLFEFSLAINRQKQLVLAKKMEKFMATYPHNTNIPIKLHHLYFHLGYKQKAYKLISHFYAKHPEHLEGLITYFLMLQSANKPLLLKRFLAKGILLEEHIANYQPITEKQYYSYYAFVAIELLKQGHLIESWRLIQHIASLPIVHKKHNGYNFSQIYYLHAGTITQQWALELATNLALYNEQLDQLANAGKDLS